MLMHASQHNLIGAVHKRRPHFFQCFDPLPPPSVTLMTSPLQKDVPNLFTPLILPHSASTINKKT